MYHEQKGRSSFLKKRSKKPLSLGARGAAPRALECKSFLLLFFKKEDSFLLNV